MNDSGDWKARATREAAAIVDGRGVNATGSTYDLLIRFVALGWLQGYDYGSHEALSKSEDAFARLMEELR